ncbi:MAG TPA: GNAT family N-acetyltransferase [Acidimicrobiia bacterium]|nr:GNAT family N-acetyltransferase [Acidimicrobiia bacterium]
MTDDGLVIRPATAADRGAIVALLATSLGRDPRDARFDALFSWKHETNAFGPSPMWVACDGDALAGFRTLMRWRFERDASTVDAVRAVDTATHPDYQGRGIFTRLTLHALDALRDEGVGFVFNTPNDQSRPGYLKMRWRVVGRVPVAVRPRTPAGLLRMARSRTAADRWSAPCDVGEPASAVTARTAELRELLASQPRSRGLRTARSPEFLAWRYGGDLLPYRCVVAPGGVREGVVFLRRRARGAARETVVADVLARGGDRRLAHALVRRAAREAGGEYAIRVAEPGPVAGGFVRLPRQGPILTWRDVCDRSMPPPGEWHVSLGDIELF